jgi:glycosyltransferase involved in cell wall biosynthesis/GT2 family glycosyltransferase
VHGEAPTAPARPGADVVIPFAGSQAALEALIERAAGIALGRGDSLTIVDNRPAGQPPAGDPPIAVIPARERPGSYYARNRGAAGGTAEWLVFVDADVDPPPDLIDRYFATSPGSEAAVLVGAIADEPAGPGERSAVARFLSERASMSQDNTSRGRWAYAQTANCAIRRSAFEAVGGFREDLRSGGDADVCFRLRAAGWELEQRPEAGVVHRNRTTLRGLVRQRARHGSGAAWLERAYPGSAPPAPLAGLARWSCREAVRAAARAVAGDRRAAASIALDPLSSLAFELGRRLPNQLAGAADGPNQLRLAVVTDQYPALSETFVSNEVAELRRLRAAVVVEATTRPAAVDPGIPGTGTSYLEDDPAAAKPLALARLLARHPLRCLRDVGDRRRWRREEPVRPLRALALRAERLRRGGVTHLHVHFAAGAALDAMRLARIEGIPYSVTAHAYEIFASPANLAEKLGRAAFATTGCEYNARHLRELLGPGVTTPIHVQVMGVDPERFRRSAPPPGGRSAVAVGRLVEKKGFAGLLDAVALLERADPLERLTIVGDGELRDPLRRRIAELGLEERVELAGAKPGAGVRAAIAAADVLVMPAVVAADGDRDSMPVVVKEAMAMEVPVVASDEVGLPELVDDAVGRLAPPGDPEALAAAIAAILALPVAERAALGRAGRERVLERCDVRRETARLRGWIAVAGAQPASSSS